MDTGEPGGPNKTKFVHHCGYLVRDRLPISTREWKKKTNAPCGGIDPYTLMARLGPAQIRGSGPPKDDARPGQPVRSPAQGVKTDLAIKQDLGRLE